MLIFTMVKSTTRNFQLIKSDEVLTQGIIENIYLFFSGFRVTVRLLKGGSVTDKFIKLVTICDNEFYIELNKRLETMELKSPAPMESSKRSREGRARLMRESRWIVRPSECLTIIT